MPGRFDSLALESTLPDGSPVRVISAAALHTAARQMGLSLRQTEIAALDREIIPERYLRNFKTLDCAAQARLLRSSVAMVGLGGLGGPILEGLARMGFGVILAADHDHFEPSNLNRQLLATERTLGMSKARAALERVADINPAVELTAREEYVAPGAFAGFYQGADIAIDALGGLACRLAAEQGAAEAGVPLITAAVAGWTAMVATVLPGAPGMASMFGLGGGECPPPGVAAEDTLGCLMPVILAAAGLVTVEAVRLALGQAPKLGGPHGKMAVLDFGQVCMEGLTLWPRR